jgi:quercetin dioxygenase-like cupin family protein
MINRIVLATVTLAGATALLAQSAPPVAAPQPWKGISRTDLQRHDLSVAGREMIRVRVDFQPGAAAPAHSHPGEEIVNMLAGSLEYRVEGRPPVTLRAGEVLFIPSGKVHSVRNVGGESASELATYLVAKGEPLITLDD